MKIFNDNILDTIIAIGSGQIAAMYVILNSSLLDFGYTLLRAVLISFACAITSLFAKWLWNKIMKK